ncbi:hypothetical protein VNO77_02698 [Canavalia gladiata]|uniref:Uncharacterized protein n=1 Tax=Canavalia gladiata TaxID=3824 RepID=A0AAN9MTM8_CANGL
MYELAQVCSKVDVRLIHSIDGTLVAVAQGLDALKILVPKFQCMRSSKSMQKGNTQSGRVGSVQPLGAEIQVAHVPLAITSLETTHAQGLKLVNLSLTLVIRLSPLGVAETWCSWLDCHTQNHKDAAPVAKKLR